MYTQHSIARVAEETVLNLKELETRIEVLKNDLAALCTNLGSPEAARLAVTPAAWIDPRAQLAQQVRQHALAGVPTSAIAPHLTSTVGNPAVSPFGIPSAVSPFQGVSPYASIPPFQGVSPYASFAPFQGISPWAATSPLGISPHAASPFGVSPYAASFSPYGSPYASAISPLQAGFPTPGFAGIR